VLARLQAKEFPALRKTLTDRGVATLKPRVKAFAFPDPEFASHYVRVQPSGSKSFFAVARDPSGRQQWIRIGTPELLTIAESRVKAREIIKRIRDGLPAVEPRREMFAAVAEEWIARHVRKKGLRSADHVERLLKTRILPAWGTREFASIRRSDISRLLDELEDRFGPRAADYALAVFRSVANWHAARHDTYAPPLVKGMRRVSAHAQARSRILTDDELRAIWRASETCGTFGAFIQLSLLTGQRRTCLANMRWSDLEDGVWTIPGEARAKGTGGALALPDMAVKIIESLPRFDSPYVFAATRGQGRIIGFSKGKVRIDRLSNTSGWALHDLRRTSRSLMSRAGVASDVGELCLGHRLGGVRGIYDRYHYFNEKRDALAKLAALIDSIVHLHDNVLPLRHKEKGHGQGQDASAAT
jgi:hypothetical protein